MLNRLAKAKNGVVFEGPRGSPNNIGSMMQAVHPMVRTHPVTGWKSVYTVGTGFMRYGKESDIGYMLDMVTINEMSPEEGFLVLDKLMSLIAKRHDLQARFQWKNPSDMGTSLIYLFIILVLSQDPGLRIHIVLSSLKISFFGELDSVANFEVDAAIWDNRCSFNLSQPPSEGPHSSSYIVGVGEKPFLDPNSHSRAEGLLKREIDDQQLFENYALSHGLAAACFN